MESDKYRMRRREIHTISRLHEELIFREGNSHYQSLQRGVDIPSIREECDRSRMRKREIHTISRLHEELIFRASEQSVIGVERRRGKFTLSAAYTRS